MLLLPLASGLEEIQTGMENDWRKHAQWDYMTNNNKSKYNDYQNNDLKIVENFEQIHFQIILIQQWIPAEGTENSY